MEYIKKSRARSLAALLAVYLLAGAVGILIARSLPLHFALALLLADIAATVLVFLFSLLFQNASVYDPYWSVQPPFIVTAYAVTRGVGLLGVLLLCAVWFWGLRLTANLAYTFRGLAHEDWRYTMLRKKTGRLYPIVNFVGIHLVPTLIVYGCTIPAVYAIVKGVEYRPLSLLFCSLAVVFAGIQGLADIDMHAFRRRGTGGFIRSGLWKYSRHPNYLCEIAEWWCIAAAVVSASGKWILFIGAFANTLLFLFVSIPLADGKQSKKPGYTEYRSETRMLLPFPKRKK